MKWYRFHVELNNCNDVDWKELVESANPSGKSIQRKENSPHSNEVNHRASHQHRNIIERLEVKYGILGGDSDDEVEEESHPISRNLATINEYEDNDFIDDSALLELAEGDDMTRRTSTKTKGFFVTDRKLDTTTSDVSATEIRRLVVRRKTRPHPATPRDIPSGVILDSKKAKTRKLVYSETVPVPKFDEEWCPNAEITSYIKAFREVYENHMKDSSVSNKAQVIPEELLSRLYSMDRSVHEKIPLAHKCKGYYQALAAFIPLSVDELHFLMVSLDKAAMLNGQVSRWTEKVREAKLSDFDEKAKGIATGDAGWIMPMDLREGLLELYEMSQIWVDAENCALKMLRPGIPSLSIHKERQRILSELQKVIPEELGLNIKALKKIVDLERRRQRQKQKIAMKKKSVEDGSETGGRAASEVVAMKIDNSQGNNRLSPCEAVDETSGGEGDSQSESKHGNTVKHEDTQVKNGDNNDELAVDMPRTGAEFALPPRGFNPSIFVVREKRDKPKGW